MRAANRSRSASRVRRVAEAQVAERRLGLEVVDRDGGCDVRFGPRGVAEVERVPELRVDRPEEERQQALVAGVREHEPYRPEPLPEPAHALLEVADAAEGDLRHLHCEAEPRRRLRRPAVEELRPGQAVRGRVQLDRGQPLGVEAQEVLGPGVGRVEAAAPRLEGEARGPRVERPARQAVSRRAARRGGPGSRPGRERWRSAGPRTHPTAPSRYGSRPRPRGRASRRRPPGRGT